MNKLYDKEFALKKGKFSSEEQAIIKDRFDFVSSNLSILDFYNASLEISTHGVINYNFHFKNNRLIMATSHLESSDVKMDEIVFTYYIDNERIMSNKIDVSIFAKGFNEYLKA